MAFIAQDIYGTLVALPALLLIVMAPGRLIAGALAFPGFVDTKSRLERACVSLLVGAATMPVILDLAGHAGPAWMSGVAGVLALLGLRASSWRGLRANWTLIAGVALWTALAIALLVDWPDGGGLHRSMQSADHVKHAAATWAIAQSGTPPYNPTFLESGRSAYYYFFYNLTATTQALTQPFGVVARQAAWAGVVFAGLLLAALAWIVYQRARFEELFDAPPASPLWRWLLALLATTGLDILPVVLIGGLVFHTWISDYEFWDTQVTSWLNSVLWVPHHITGLAAAWVGFLALADAHAQPTARWRPAALAGLAFASCAGLSIYVAFGATLTAAGFVGWLARQRRWGDALSWCAAGVVALVVALPWLVSLVSGRPVSGGEAPVAFELRAVPILDVMVTSQPWRNLGRLLTLPIAYSIEFGVFLLGSAVFWWRAGARGLGSDVARLLVVSAIVSFLVGTFLRSTVLLNDLGWRIMLFAQLSSLVWTLAAIRGGLFNPAPGDSEGRLQKWLWACIVLGYAADAYGMAQMRRYVEETPAEVALAPDERTAWEWLSNHLPVNTIVEENPDRYRAFGYGLYGHFREAVSDHYNGILFGSNKDAVEARIRLLKPVFDDIDLTPEEAMALATQAGVDVIVLRETDRVFAEHSAWPWAVPALYANGRMRAIKVAPRALASRTAP